MTSLLASENLSHRVQTLAPTPASLPNTSSWKRQEMVTSPVYVTIQYSFFLSEQITVWLENNKSLFPVVPNTPCVRDMQGEKHRSE